MILKTESLVNTAPMGGVQTCPYLFRHVHSTYVTD